MIYYIGLLTIVLEIVILALYIRMIRRVEQENIALENNIHQAELYYNNLKDRSDNIRRFRHDLKKHIRIVEQFLIQNQEWEDLEEYRQLQGYMEKMKDDLAGTEGNGSCDVLIHAVCHILNGMCEEAQISFSTDISIKSDDLKAMDPYHLTGILMNLLDNAYEACRHRTGITPNDILLKISKEKDGILFLVGNHVPDGFDMSFKTIKPDKDIHGIGLGIAREYAAIYGGSLEFDYDSSSHFLTIKTVLNP